MKNVINWFEIPVEDFGRAKKFYEAIFACEIPGQDMMGAQMGFFPSEAGADGGAIVKSAEHKPSNEGTLVYLNGNPNLSTILDRVEKATG